MALSFCGKTSQANTARTVGQMGQSGYPLVGRCWYPRPEDLGSDEETWIKVLAAFPIGCYAIANSRIGLRGFPREKIPVETPSPEASLQGNSVITTGPLCLVFIKTLKDEPNE